jgi:signal peptidase
METSPKYSPTRISSTRIALVIIFLFSIYFLENSHITNYIDSYIFSYVITPILWIIVAIIVYRIPHMKSMGKLKYKSSLKFWTIYFGIIYVVITLLAGLIDGLGKSPYSHTLKGIIMNIAFVGASLVGREFIRNYLVSSFAKKERYLIFVLISLFMTITNFSISKYLSIVSLKELVQFLAEFMIPEFSHNFFATYLVFLGGPTLSIIYLGIIQGFHWLSPILPDLTWITTALIGIMCPIFFQMTMQSIYLNNTKQIKKREQNDESPVGWLFTSVISIGIIWFAVGVFPIYPSVIATGSMEPMIKPGDIILVKKIVDMDGINALHEGDIIQFKRDNILISHRIIEVVSDEKEGIKFRTKGDNNSAVDFNLVEAQDVKGTIEYTIPKIGWPTLLIKSDKEIDLDDIVF